MLKHYGRICSTYLNVPAVYVSDVAFWLNNCHIWRKEAWKDIKEYIFEYTKIYGPKEFDEVLKEQYGNYQKYIIGKSEHGEVFFDTEKPYTYYLNEGREELEKYATTEH